jgi:hypothetical protein
VMSAMCASMSIEQHGRPLHDGNAGHDSTPVQVGLRAVIVHELDCITTLPSRV